MDQSQLAWLDSALKVILSFGAGAGLLVYFVGFLAAALRLQRGGVSLAKVPHRVFIAAGLLFLLLAVPPALLAGLACVLRTPSGPFAFVAALVLATVFTFWVAHHGGQYVFLALFNLANLLMSLLNGLLVRLSDTSVFVIATLVLAQVLAVAFLFSSFAYECIPSSLGGGMPRPVELRLTREGVEALGEDLHDLLTSWLRTGPVYRDLFEVHQGADDIHLAAFDIPLTQPASSGLPGLRVRRAGILRRALRATLRSSRIALAIDQARFFAIPRRFIAAIEYLPLRDWDSARSLPGTPEALAAANAFLAAVGRAESPRAGKGP